MTGVHAGEQRRSVGSRGEPLPHPKTKPVGTTGFRTNAKVESGAQALPRTLSTGAASTAVAPP